jgi:hypothetical protein
MGGTTGRVPDSWHQALLKAAEDQRKILTIEHLRSGKPWITRQIHRIL